MKTASAVVTFVLVILLASTVSAQVIEEWVVRYDGPAAPAGNFPDWGYAITTDDAGNIYVTGGSHIAATDDDCTTIKYAPDGTVLWMNRYHHFAEDWGYAIAVDRDGCAHVTGLSSSESNGYDYITIKYNADGTTQWVSRFDGTSHDNDAAYAIRVDASGSVYVTGRSTSSPYHENDYVTIKYAADGTELWAASYDGAYHGDDRAHAMTVDADGNVYVTGGSETPSGVMDFATVKYDPDGNELWVATRPGIYDVFGGGWDIALDPAGDLLVFGRSDVAGTGHDYETVKYDPTGAEIWSARYDGPANGTEAACTMIVDELGSVYVTGRSVGVGSGFDYATVKYDTDGAEQWVRRYDGPAAGVDRAYRIALGGDGCISVTGYSDGVGTGTDYATVKYDTDGNFQWSARYDGPAGSTDWGWAIAADGDGNVIVTGKSAGIGTDLDYATVKYGPGGTKLWTAIYAGPPGTGLQDWAYAMAVDADGNSYVTGASLDPFADDDIKTFKYDADGNEVWSASYNGPASGEDWGYAIAVDDDGCAYVTGLSDGVDTGRDYVTIKYAADGTEQWVSRYDGPALGPGHDAAYAIGLDDAGNVFVTGNSAGDDPLYSADYATVKYAPDGTELWAARYDHGWDDDRAHALDVGPGGSVYVTGGSSSGSRHDVATIKYAPDGTEQWVQRSQGAINTDGGGWAVRVGPGGDAWVGARTCDVTPDYDFSVLRYGSDGALQWEAVYDGPAGEDDKVCDMVVDDAGNAYVTGYSMSATGFDYATVKYSAGGIEEWVARYDGPGSDDDRPYEAALTPTGVAVVGKSVGFMTGYDYATVCYTAFGEEEWAMRYDGPDGGEDWGYAMGADAAGNVYVTGKSTGIESGFDYATIKYAVDTGTPVEGYCYAVATESGGVRVRWDVASLADIQAFSVWRATSEEGPFVRLNDAPLPAEPNGVFEDLSVWPDEEFWYEVRATLLDGSEEAVSGSPVSVRTGGVLVTRLYPVAPNPVAGPATLSFDLADHTGPVSLVVHNVRGQVVRSVVDGPLERGRHVRTWDGCDDRGLQAAAGVYFIKLRVDDKEETAKAIVLR